VEIEAALDVLADMELPDRDALWRDTVDSSASKRLTRPTLQLSTPHANQVAPALKIE
jgi:hypothetical protein